MSQSQQQQLDLIIVFVYMISVVYVIYVALKAEENKVTVKFERESLDRQLDEKNLKDVVDVKFKLEDRYNFDALKDLAITVENKSKDALIEIDWDRSSIVNDGKSRRLIRFTADRQVDLSQRQVFSAIASGGSITEKITAEDLLKLNDGKLEASAPILNIEGLKKGNASKYAEFMQSKTSLKFAVRLALRVIDMIEGNEIIRPYVLVCEFVMSRVPWPQSLPWKP